MTTEFLSRNKKNWVIVVLPLIFLLLFLYEPIRATITPLLLGGVVAYLLNPVVRFCSRKLHIPRIVSISIILALFLLASIFFIIKIVDVVNFEVRQLTEDSQYFVNQYTKHVESLPPVVQPFAEFFFGSVKDLPNVKPAQTIPFVESIVGRLLHTFAFFVTLFYLLRDGDELALLIKKSSLTDKIHKTLQSYFRGQLFLILAMALLTWIFLSILHVRFALLLSLFTGFAELIPMVGPLFAGILSVVVVFFTQNASIADSTVLTAAVVALGYFTFRQVEDFFIMPYVISRSVELHPLVILFTTLLAGRLFGVMGLLFGVPFVAVYKILLEECWPD